MKENLKEYLKDKLKYKLIEGKGVPIRPVPRDDGWVPEYIYPKIPNPADPNGPWIENIHAKPVFTGNWVPPAISPNRGGRRPVQPTGPNYGPNIPTPAGNPSISPGPTSYPPPPPQSPSHPWYPAPLIIA